MFKRLIVVTDLSGASYAVIEKAAELRKLGAEHCLLLMCMGKGHARSLYYL